MKIPFFTDVRVLLALLCLILPGCHTGERVMDSGKPSTEGEGIAGYIAKPNAIKIELSDNGTRILAPEGTFALHASNRTLSSVTQIHVGVWTATREELKTAQSQSVFTLSRPSDLYFQPKSDGAVDILFPESLDGATYVIYAVLDSPDQQSIPMRNPDQPATSAFGYVPSGESLPLFDTRPGDLTFDGRVDGDDLDIFSNECFLKSEGELGYRPDCDFDGDGDVDGQDYARFGSYYNN